jgi:hypothetical protein
MLYNDMIIQLKGTILCSWDEVESVMIYYKIKDINLIFFFVFFNINLNLNLDAI